MSNLNITDWLNGGGGIVPIAQGYIETKFAISVGARQFYGYGCVCSWNSNTGVLTITLNAGYSDASKLVILTQVIGLDGAVLLTPANDVSVAFGAAVPPDPIILTVSIPRLKTGSGEFDPEFWPAFYFMIFAQDKTPVNMVDTGS